MRPLSVAMVAACPFPYPRGTPIRIYRLANALSQKDINVFVVTYHLGQPTNTADFQVTRIPHIRTYNRLAPGPNYQKLLVVDPILAVTLRKLLKQQRIDLIHAHHYEGLLVALAARDPLRHPVVYDAHTLLESELPYYQLGVTRVVKKALGKYLDHLLPRKAEHIITVTERIKHHLIHEANVKAENVTVVSNGIEAESFSDLGQKKNSPHGDVSTVIFAGNLANYQGIELLLRAFRLVIDVKPDARLLIVSNSPFDSYDDLAATLDIREKIEITDADFCLLPKLLAAADVAVNPRTDCDGIPQKLLNYMAAGLPIVSFAGSAVTITHGVSGWIVDDNDVAGFANGIVFLLSNSSLAAELGSNAQAVGKKEYSWDCSASKTIAVYEKVLAQQSASSRR